MAGVDSHPCDHCPSRQLWAYGADSYPHSACKQPQAASCCSQLTKCFQGPYSRGVEWPMMLMAILATIIQVAGLIPPFFELAKRDGRVIGIGMEAASLPRGRYCG